MRQDEVARTADLFAFPRRFDLVEELDVAVLRGELLRYVFDVGLKYGSVVVRNIGVPLFLANLDECAEKLVN